MQPFGYAYNQYLQKRINIHSTERGVKIVLKVFGVYAWTRRKTALYLSKIYLMKNCKTYRINSALPS